MGGDHGVADLPPFPLGRRRYLSLGTYWKKSQNFLRASRTLKSQIFLRASRENLKDFLRASREVHQSEIN